MIVVTGGASGIGAAIVRAAMAEGAIPVIVDRAEKSTIVADLIDPENCRRAVEETIEKFGSIDALVNNAGVNDRVGLSEEVPRTMWRRSSAIFLHYYNMAHYALPALKNRKGPS